MKNVVDGYRRFRSEAHAAGPDLFERLTEGQNPEAMVIACSDSRVSPSLLTSSKLGTIFVSRNAGNIVPPFTADGGGEAATIEFAVSYLKVRNIVVLGHSHCGAMRGLMTPHSCDHMPLVARWLGHAHAAREVVTHMADPPTGEALITRAAQENIALQLDHLRTYPAVRAQMHAHALALHAWFFDIGTGTILERRRDGSFTPLDDHDHAVEV